MLLGVARLMLVCCGALSCVRLRCVICVGCVGVVYCWVRWCFVGLYVFYALCCVVLLFVLLCCVELCLVSCCVVLCCVVL